MIIDLAHCNFVNSFEVLFDCQDSLRKSKPNFSHRMDLCQMPSAIRLHLLTSFLANLSLEFPEFAESMPDPWKFVLIDLNAKEMPYVIIKV